MTDFCGLAPVVAHYVILEAWAGAAMSALYMAIDITAVFHGENRVVRRLYYLYYPLAALLVGVTYRGAADLLALFGTLTAIASRQQPAMGRLLALIVVSSVGWGLYGVFAPSYGQIAFSSFYALFSLLGIFRIRHLTHG